MPLEDELVSLALAALLGMLIGFERQRSQSRIGGLRTFTFVCLFGAAMALLSVHTGPVTLGAGLVALAAIVIMSNYIRVRKSDDVTPGMTTEAAILVTYAIGAMVVHVDRTIAAAAAALVAVLLHLKEPLHKATARLGDEDVHAIMRFVIITLIILPVVPNERMGPFDAVNPYKLWLMVGLIVGISLAGYLAFKFTSKEKGVLLAGIFGGMASSTATTVSASRQATSQPGAARAMAVVAVLATAVVYARVCVEIFAAAPTEGRALIAPVAAMFGMSVVVALVCWKIIVKDGTPEIDPGRNPSRLAPALVFAGIFAAVQIGIACVQTTPLASSGVFLVAAISGLTDIDAVTLTLADQVERGMLRSSTAWRAIIVASIANLAFKAGIIASVGTRQMLRASLAPFGIIAGAGLATVLLWPA